MSTSPTAMHGLPQRPDDTTRGWREPAWLRRPDGPRSRLPFGGPVMWWALVMVMALLSFYVYVLQEQVLRGEQARQALLDQSARGPLAAAAARPADPGGESFDLMPPALQLRVGASR